MVFLGGLHGTPLGHQREWKYLGHISVNVIHNHATYMLWKGLSSITILALKRHQLLRTLLPDPNQGALPPDPCCPSPPLTIYPGATPVCNHATYVQQMHKPIRKSEQWHDIYGSLCGLKISWSEPFCTKRIMFTYAAKVITCKHDVGIGPGTA